MSKKCKILQAKISQSLSANEHWSDDLPFEKGNRVVLLTLHRHRDYKAKDEHQVAKFMPRYNGPYLITETAPEISTITTDMPNHPNTFPIFHTSQSLPFIENDKELFPGCELDKPPAVIINLQEKYTIHRILEEQKHGWGIQYLVCWCGYGSEEDRWLPGRELKDCEALDIWSAQKDRVLP